MFHDGIDEPLRNPDNKAIVEGLNCFVLIRLPLARFMPSDTRAIDTAWWALSVECHEAMLGTVGFKVVSKTITEPKCPVKSRLGKEQCVTIVADRFAGQAIGIDSSSAAA